MNAPLLDVRDLLETAAEEGPEAPNILVGKLLPRLGELPRDRESQCFYIATRILLQNGFKARNISSGMFFLAPPAQSGLWRRRAARSQRIAGGARLGSPQLLGKLAFGLDGWLGGKR